MNNLIYNYLLKEGALAWVSPNLAQYDLSFLGFLDLYRHHRRHGSDRRDGLDRYMPKLYGALGVFLPLIAVNCAILGASLWMVERDYTLGESAVFGIGSGIGWALAIVALAAIRERLRYHDIPAALRGLGITFIITGLMALGFMTFGGIQL